MAGAVVQHPTKAQASGATATVTVAHPTLGNVLCAWGNSDATISTPTDNGTGAAWTLGPSNVDGNGAYLWYKQVAAGDTTMTTVTFTPGASTTITCGVIEVSGVAASAVDVFNANGASTGGSFTSTPSVSVTTTGANGDFVIHMGLLHSSVAHNQATSPSWTNGFTLLDNIFESTAVEEDSLIATLNQATAGAISSVVSWTNTYIDAPAFIIAFKLAATATLAPVRRRQARPAAGLVRTRSRIVVPAQVPVPVKVPERTAQRSPARELAALRRGRQAQVVQTQAATVVARTPDRTSQAERRRVLGSQARGRVARVVPPQDDVAADSIIISGKSRQRAAAALVRGHQPRVTPPQIPVPVKVPDRISQRAPARQLAALRRGRRADVVQTQASPTVGFTIVQTPTPVITTAVTSTNIVFGSNVTAGDLLVLNVRYGAAVTPQITDTLGDGVAWIQDSNYGPGSTNGYVFHKVCGLTGACTITVGQTGAVSTTIRVAVREYAGNLNDNVNVTDGTGATAGSATQASPLSVGPSATTYAAGDLVVMAVGGGGNQTLTAGGSAPNSDLVQSTANGTIALEDNLNWVGGQATATVGWAGGTENLYGAVVAYKAATVTSTWVPQWRHTVRLAAALVRSRPRVVLPAQVPVLVRAPDRTGPAQRQRILAAQARGRTARVVPTADGVTASGKGRPRPAVQQVRGRRWFPTPAQVPVPVKTADQTSQRARRLSFALQPRGKRSWPTPAQVPPPLWPPMLLTQRRAWKGWPQGRGRQVVPTPAHDATPVDRTETQPSRRLTFALTRRGRTFTPTPAQIPVPPRKPDDPTQHRAVRGWLRTRPRRGDPPWAQTVAPGNPPITFNPSQRRVLRGWPQGRGHLAQIVPAQVLVPVKVADVKRAAFRPLAALRRGRRADAPLAPTPVNPKIALNPSQRRAVRGWAQGRGRQTVPTPLQPAAVASRPAPSGNRRIPGFLARRGRPAVPAGVHAHVPAPVRRPRLVGAVRVLRRRPDVPPAQPAPVNPKIVLNPGQRRPLRAWLLRRGRSWVPPWFTRTTIPPGIHEPSDATNGPPVTRATFTGSTTGGTLGGGSAGGELGGGTSGGSFGRGDTGANPT